MKKDDLILVIDMQKVYMPGQPWACDNVEKIVTKISEILDKVININEGIENGLIEERRGSGAGVESLDIKPCHNDAFTKAPDVVLTRFIAPADEDAVGTWSQYNELNKKINENHVMEEFIPAVARYVEDFPYYDKCNYSCFSNPYVRAAADKAMVHGGDIVLTGVVSECCVLSTFFQGVDLGYHFVYLKDACAGVDAETERAVEKVLEGLSYVHVDIMTTKEYLEE